jgi:hypothetical protein
MDSTARSAAPSLDAELYGDADASGEDAVVGNVSWTNPASQLGLPAGFGSGAEADLHPAK